MTVKNRGYLPRAQGSPFASGFDGCDAGVALLNTCTCSRWRGVPLAGRGWGFCKAGKTRDHVVVTRVPAMAVGDSIIRAPK